LRSPQRRPAIVTERCDRFATARRRVTEASPDAALTHAPIAWGARKQSDGVCLAHNPEVATRWALGLRSRLTRRWQSRNDAAMPGAGALN
jgi:hypothetical protein